MAKVNKLASEKVTLHRDDDPRMIDYPTRTETLEITPQKAEDLLSRRKQNRRPSKKLIARYANEMKAKRWRLNGEPIILDQNNRLIDGQHRLMACIEANVSFITDVKYGINEHFMATMNSGKSRVIGDLFSIYDVKFPVLTASVAKLLLHWKKHFVDILTERQWFRQRMNYHQTEILEFYHANDGIINHAVGRFNPKFPIVKKTGVAPLAFTYIILKELNQDLTLKFFDRYESGLGIDKEWIAMKEVRDRFLAKLQKERTYDYESISILFGLWNCVQLGIGSKRIEDEAFNVPQGLIR